MTVPGYLLRIKSRPYNYVNIVTITPSWLLRINQNRRLDVNYARLFAIDAPRLEQSREEGEVQSELKASEQSAATAPRREDWLRDSVISGFLATFAMTVVVAAAYGFSRSLGDEDGSTVERWLWGLSHNPIINSTDDQVVLAIALNLLMGMVLALVYGAVVEPALSGPGWKKGILFSLVPFILSVVAFFPVMGGGFLGSEIDAGPLPVLGNLILHLVYGAVLGSVYGIALESGLDDTDAERANAAAAERGTAIGGLIGLALGALAGWIIGPSLDSLGTRNAIALGGAMIGAAIGAMAGSMLGMGGVERPT